MAEGELSVRDMFMVALAARGARLMARRAGYVIMTRTARPAADTFYFIGDDTSLTFGVVHDNAHVVSTEFRRRLVAEAKGELPSPPLAEVRDGNGGSWLMPKGGHCE